ncbi:hypothetical protein, partial [Rhodovulum steppense]
GLFDLADPGAEPDPRILGEIDRIGNGPQMRATDGDGMPLSAMKQPQADAAALTRALDRIAQTHPKARIAAVGYSVFRHRGETNISADRYRMCVRFIPAAGEIVIQGRCGRACGYRVCPAVALTPINAHGAAVRLG